MIATCLRRNPDARLRMICFPHAGGGAWAYRTWAEELPADLHRDVECWAVNLPGRDGGVQATPFTDLLAVVDVLRDELGACLTKPFMFFGHSMGALLGFELASRLAAAGDPVPVRLVVSGHRAPQLPNPHPAVHDRPDEQVLAKIRTLGGTPDGILDDQELTELMLPVIRAEFGLCERYTYNPRDALGCPLTAFGGFDDPEVTRDELAAWEELTRADFELRMFPGGHFFLDSAQPLVLRVLGHELRAALRTASLQP